MIRPLKSSDIPIIINIYELSNASIGLPVQKDYFKHDAKKYVSSTIYKCENLVYEIDGLPVGIISVSADYVEGLFVFPDFWGQGVGRALLESFLSKKEYLCLQVYELNSRAVRFYLKNGFKVISGGICQMTGFAYFEMAYEKK